VATIANAARIAPANRAVALVERPRPKQLVPPRRKTRVHAETAVNAGKAVRVIIVLAIQSWSVRVRRQVVAVRIRIVRVGIIVSAGMIVRVIIVRASVGRRGRAVLLWRRGRVLVGRIVVCVGRTVLVRDVLGRWWRKKRARRWRRGLVRADLVVIVGKTASAHRVLREIVR